VLEAGEGVVSCTEGHAFPVVDGIPVLLDPTVRPTQEGYWATGEEVYPSEELPQPVGDEVDQYVRWLLRGTCGNLYDGERVSEYPIPTFPLAGPGRLLDIGSNWGRWSIAAARAGFDVVAIDPSLGAMRAARRVARQLDVDLDVIVADARHAPFPDGSFDVVFSYSVLQHLAPADVKECADECARLLRPGGIALHQLPNAYGVRSVYRQAARRFRPAGGFEVRYWTPMQLRRLFGDAIGPTVLSVDGFLTLNPHPGDAGLLSRRPRAVVRTSRALTRLSRHAPPLQRIADSFWVRSTRR
jgi:SAM-dependent methyltransferase